MCWIFPVQVKWSPATKSVTATDAVSDSPQSHRGALLDVAFLWKARIEVDRDLDEVLQVRCRFGVVENLIVEGVMEGDAEMRLQRRVGAPDVVEPSDLGDDVAGRLPIPGADFVFLRRIVLLAAG